MKTVNLVNKENRESSVDSCQTDVNLNFRVHDIDNDLTTAFKTDPLTHYIYDTRPAFHASDDIESFHHQEQML